MSASARKKHRTVGATLAALLSASMAVWAAPTGLDRLRTGHDVLVAPPSPQPPLFQPFRDPVFGTKITRITDPSQMPNVTRVRHYYSKSDPFNADGSYAVLFASDGTIALYDARIWTYQRRLRFANGDPEIQWDRKDPNIFYYVEKPSAGAKDVRAIMRYDIRNDDIQLVHDFAEYDGARGRLEGNMDREGRYYALVAWKVKEKVVDAIVFDLKEKRIHSRTRVEPRMIDDWISMSPSGKYVVMMGKDRSRVYDTELKPLRELPAGSFGHGDLCQLADGSEALVYDGADRQLDSNRNINIADLATGRERAGVRIGWGSTPHVSCRNLDFPGWALISTQGPDKKYPNHDFEIFWLKLDGSNEVRRVAHHHSQRARGGYFAEQHAVTNRTGDRIVFASNWDGNVVNDYLIELDSAAAAAAPAQDRGAGTRK